MIKDLPGRRFLYMVLIVVLLSAACRQPVSKQIIMDGPISKDAIILLKFPDSKSKDSLPGLLSSIASGVEYIPLETRPDCLLGGNFVDITPSIHGYFIKNNGVIFRFSPEGKFLCRINTIGRGPTEYGCQSFFVDETNKLVVSTGFYTRVFFFTDLDGNLQYTVRYPKHEALNLEIQSIKQLSNKKLIVTYYNEDGRSKLLFSVLDYQGNILHDEYNPHILQDTYRSKELLLYSYSNYGFYSLSNQLYYLNIPADTIYSIKEDYSLKEHALIDAGSYKMTKEEDVKISAGILDLDLLKDRMAHFFVGESERFLFLSHQSFGKRQMAIWDKAKESAIYNYYPDFTDDINGLGTLYIYPTSVKDSCLYSYIQAFDFIDYVKQNTSNERLSQNAKISSVMRKIVEESNPVIIKVQLKK